MASKQNKGQKQAVVYDHLYTPAYAVEPLIRYLKRRFFFRRLLGLKTIIWECTGNRGNIAAVLRDHNFTVIETNIEHGFDFLNHGPSFRFHAIVTNPPYSLKDQFLQKCFAYNKPFALLLPVTACTGSKKRVPMYLKYNIQMLFLDGRVNYTGGSGNWKNTSWFCWKMLDYPFFHRMNIHKFGQLNKPTKRRSNKQ